MRNRSLTVQNFQNKTGRTRNRNISKHSVTFGYICSIPMIPINELWFWSVYKIRNRPIPMIDSWCPPHGPHSSFEWLWIRFGKGKCIRQIGTGALWTTHKANAFTKHQKRLFLGATNTAETSPCVWSGTPKSALCVCVCSVHRLSFAVRAFVRCSLAVHWLLTMRPNVHSNSELRVLRIRPCVTSSFQYREKNQELKSGARTSFLYFRIE